MDILEAMQRRHSVRQYRDMPLSTEVKERLQQEIDACNREGDLHLQLVTDEPGAFSGAMARYGRFSGVQNYIAVAGKKAPDLDERAGYYGQRIVLLAQQLGMKKELEPNQVAVGAKMVIKLGEDVINQRFGLNGNEGMAWLSAVAPSDGNFGGGLLYTNKDSVSVGIVATLSDIGHSDLSVPQMLDRFMAHPSIAPYLEGGTPIEYSGHLVPEEGYGMIPELVRDGVLVTGDAAGFCVNLGFTVRGMDFAIESGRLAAEAVLRAHEVGDFSAKTLSYYEELLKNSFVMRDLKEYKGFPTILTERAIFEDVPQTADAICNKLFTVDGQPADGVLQFALNEIAEKCSARELVDMITKMVEAF